MKSPDTSEAQGVINHERHDPFTRNARLLSYRIQRSLQELSIIEKSNPAFFQAPEMVELLNALYSRLAYLQAYLERPVPSEALLNRYIEALDSVDQWEDTQLSIIASLFKANLLGFEGSALKDYLLSNFEISKLGVAVHFTNPLLPTSTDSKKSHTAAEYENRSSLIRVFDTHDNSYDNLLRSLAIHGIVSFQISVLYHELIHRNQLGNVAVFPEIAAIIAPFILTAKVYQDKFHQTVIKLNNLFKNRFADTANQLRYRPSKMESYFYMLIELDAYFAGFPFGFNILDGNSIHRLIDLLMTSESYRGINADVTSKDKSVLLAERLLFLKANGCPPSILNSLIRGSDFDERSHSFTYIDEFVQALKSNLPSHTRKQWKVYMNAWILDWETERFINQIKVATFVQDELRKRAITLT